eukprot:TRINITY_DN13352_c0_g2_i2.p1 TRINITY_DN13352_c0_g2~~TRINITY_DN13352_c0_g2_i2.p1  ORF type:complete len:148 (+),score=21.79 TRINITY_DN13352_c0_g2_i2:161-604(+)
MAKHCFGKSKYDDVVNHFIDISSTQVIYHAFGLIALVGFLYILEIITYFVLSMLLQRQKIPNGRARDYLGFNLNCFRLEDNPPQEEYRNLGTELRPRVELVPTVDSRPRAEPTPYIVSPPARKPEETYNPRHFPSPDSEYYLSLIHI